MRQKIVAALQGVVPAAERAEKLRILVVGGSQGARGVSELVLAAAPLLIDAGVDFSIVHQTGAADLERLSERYRALGLDGRVTVKAFIEDMAAAYAGADLVVARAGALTLAELAIAGKPAILVPLPTAADDHQSKNAARFAETGAAIMLDQRKASAGDLAAALRDLARDRGRRTAMSAAMRGLSRPRAAQDIADSLEAMARER